MAENMNKNVRNFNTSKNKNTFDITNLDLYYGVKNSGINKKDPSGSALRMTKEQHHSERILAGTKLPMRTKTTLFVSANNPRKQSEESITKRSFGFHPQDDDKNVSLSCHSVGITPRHSEQSEESKIKTNKPSNIISAIDYLNKKKQLSQNNILPLHQQRGVKKPSKLAVASLAIALSMFMTPAIADEPIPTLDKLNQQGIINPSTMDKDDDGNPIEGTGEVYPESPPQNNRETIQLPSTKKQK